MDLGKNVCPLRRLVQADPKPVYAGSRSNFPTTTLTVQSASRTWPPMYRSSAAFRYSAAVPLARADIGTLFSPMTSLPCA